MAINSSAPACDVGLIGLAVMGQNLALNLADHGYRVAVYNRTHDVTDKFISERPLWHRLLQRSTSESGRLCRGDRA